MEQTSIPFRKASFWKNEPYRILELCAVAAPDGSAERNWFRYVISQGGTPIEGLRHGSEASVTAAVEEFVFNLNERRTGASTQWRPSQGAKKAGRPKKAAAATTEE